MSRNIETQKSDKRGKIEFSLHKNLGEFGIKHAKPLRFEEILAERGDKLGELSLYTHIPFCSEICSFCAFHRNIGGDNRKEKFVGSLEGHIDKTLGQLKPDQKISRIYYGGGTPSLLNIEQVARLQQRIGSHVDTSNAEVSFELHPENITEKYIRGLQSIGIDRFSVGVQNLSTNERDTLHRNVTSVQQDLERLQMLNELGVQYNLDLMFGTPNQTTESWQDTLERVIEEGHPPEITTYQYVNAFGAATRVQIAQGKVERPDLKTTHQMYKEAQRHFTTHGYKQSSTLSYESEEGATRERRVLNTGKDYLGLGPRTYSKIGPWYFVNTGKTNDFIPQSDTTEFFGLKVPEIVDRSLNATSSVTKSANDSREKSSPLGAWKSEAVTQIYGVLYYVLNQRAYPGSVREHTIVDLQNRPKNTE